MYVTWTQREETFQSWRGTEREGGEMGRVAYKSEQSIMIYMYEKATMKPFLRYANQHLINQQQKKKHPVFYQVTLGVLV